MMRATMGVLTLAIMATNVGCPPKPPNTGPIEYVGGTDPHPGVPEEPLAPQQKCESTTELAPLDNFTGNLPTGTSEDDLYNAALQFMIAGGSIKIESQDPVAHTIVTKPFTGQTLLSSCGVNQYRVYSLRVVVVGTRVVITPDCLASFGWEAHGSGGVAMPTDRGELRACSEPRYASKGDASIPLMIFEGAVGMMDLRRDPSGGAHWWCYRGDVTCYRDRSECMSKIKDEAVTCEPRARAYCRSIGPQSLCAGSLDSCAFDGTKRGAVAACIYQP